MRSGLVILKSTPKTYYRTVARVGLLSFALLLTLPTMTLRSEAQDHSDHTYEKSVTLLHSRSKSDRERAWAHLAAAGPRALPSLVTALCAGPPRVTYSPTVKNIGPGYSNDILPSLYVYILQHNNESSKRLKEATNIAQALIFAHYLAVPQSRPTIVPASRTSTPGVIYVEWPLDGVDTSISGRRLSLVSRSPVLQTDRQIIFLMLCGDFAFADLCDGDIDYGSFLLRKKNGKWMVLRAL